VRLIITDDYGTLSRAGADLIADLIATEPTARIILATGETPMGVYGELAARRRRGEFDASHARIFQLDAYLGLGADDHRSLYGWMKRSFLDPLAVPEDNVVRLRGDTRNPEEACRAYDAAIEAAGGIDLAVLGLGPNGHLGFNEPPADDDAPTRVVELTPASVESNARYWGGRDRVPRQALTAGMTTLLAARRTLLVVSGPHKRDILRRAVEGPITPDVPASYLRRAAGVTVLADRAAWPGPAAASIGNV